MRSVIISVILFVVVSVGAFYCVAHNEEELTLLLDELCQMEDQIIAENWTGAQQIFSKIKEQWQDKSFYWRLIIDQETLTDIETNLLRTGAYTHAEDYAQSMAELSSLYAQYRQLLLQEALTFNNIF